MNKRTIARVSNAVEVLLLGWWGISLIYSWWTDYQIRKTIAEQNDRLRAKLDLSSTYGKYATDSIHPPKRHVWEYAGLIVFGFTAVVAFVAAIVVNSMGIH